MEQSAVMTVYLQQLAAKADLFSSQDIDANLAIVSIGMCLPQRRGAPGTQLVTTLRRHEARKILALESS